MKAAPTFLFLGVLFAVIGCKSVRRESDLDLNGVFESRITVMSDHAGPGVYPVEVLADANSKIEEHLDQLTHDPMNRCAIAPKYYGYDVILLLRERSPKIEEEMRKYVDKAVDESWRAFHARQAKEKQANQ